MFDEFDEDKDFNQNLSIYRQFLIRSLVNLKTGQLFGMTLKEDIFVFGNVWERKKE